jgi:ATP-dependent DNA ligase
MTKTTMFLYPPRPEKAIAPSLIEWYENLGYVAQLKKNGTCSLAFVSADGKVTFKTRHNEDHKAWTPTKEITDYFSTFPDSIFVFELLHNKSPLVKDTAYVFDIIRYLGKDLVGVTFSERMQILNKVVPLMNDKIMLAKTYDSCLTGLFQSLDSPLDEGIVLKNPEAVLEPCYRATSNTAWQVKCRKRTKNYSS